MMAMRACDWRRQWETTGEHVKEGCRPPGRHDLWYSGGFLFLREMGRALGMSEGHRQRSIRDWGNHEQNRRTRR